MWTPAGPNADVYVLAADPVVSGTLYASTGQGTFRSVDHGVTWAPFPSTPDGLPPYAFGIDPFHPGTLLIGTNHVYRTEDDGATWADVTPPTYGGLFEPSFLRFDPRIENRLYAGDQSRGAFRSDDAGAHWTALDTGLYDPMDIAVDPNDPSRIFMGTWSGRVYRSPDAGASWTNVTRPPFGYVILKMAFAGAGFPGLFCVTDGLLSETFDGGQSWLRPTLPGAYGRPTSLAVDPAHPENVYLTLSPPGSIPELPPPFPYPVLRSQDGGRTWTPMMSGLTLYSAIGGLAADATGGWVYGVGETGTLSYQIVENPLAATIPALSPIAAAVMAVLLAASAVLVLKRP